MSKMDESRPFLPVNIAVLTVSDTRSLAEDRSGDTLAERIRAAGHIVVERKIVKDEAALITSQLKAWIADPKVDVVISTGGTGFTGRDVTPEAFHAVYEKEIVGRVRSRTRGTTSSSGSSTTGTAPATSSS